MDVLFLWCNVNDNRENGTNNTDNSTYGDKGELSITSHLFGLQIFSLALNILDVLLHSMAIYALLSLYSKSRQKIQRLFLIHLSVSIALVNVVEFCRKLPLLFLTTMQSREPYLQVEPYIKILTFTGVSMVPYFVMIFLTADRLANIALSFHYHKYWSKNKTKHLLTITWVSCLIVMLGIQLAYAYRHFSWVRYFFTYVYPIIECTFILTAFITYMSIIYICYRSRRKLWHKGSRKKKKLGRTKANKASSANFKKQYFIPVLLISTFIIFMTIPDFIYLFVAVIYEKPSEMLSTLCSCSYAVSNLADAAIYVFLVPDIRNFLRERLRSLYEGLRCCVVDINNNDDSCAGDNVVILYNRRVSQVAIHPSKNEFHVKENHLCVDGGKVARLERIDSNMEDEAARTDVR